MSKNNDKTDSNNKDILPTIWRIPDGLWPLVERVLVTYDPPPKMGRPRMNPRQALDGIIYRMRTGCQWNQLPKEFGDDASIHRTMQRWEALGIFDILWAVLISKCDDLRAVEWEWQAADGAMGKARGVPKRGRRTRRKSDTMPKNVSDATPPTEVKQASRGRCLSKEAAGRLLSA